MSKYILLVVVAFSGCVSSHKYNALLATYQHLDSQVVDVVNYCAEIHSQNEAITKELHACDAKAKKRGRK